MSPSLTEKDINRFTNRYTTLSEEECWLFNGALAGNGYPQISVNDKMYYVHRIAYEIFTGQSIPSELTVRHKCGVKNCVNPYHLSLSTSKSYIEERFWKAVDTSEDSDCWVYKGNLHKGYGVFNLGLERILAHRFSYSLEHGPIPNGLFVCHKCDNPPCVNPAHLFLGTHKENMQDMVNKLRHAYGVKHRSAKLTPEKVKLIRRLYGTKREYTISSFAKMFGVSYATIWYVVNRRTWKAETRP